MMVYTYGTNPMLYSTSGWMMSR